MLGGTCLGVLISFPPFAPGLLHALSSGSPVLGDMVPFVTGAIDGIGTPAPGDAGLGTLAILSPAVALAILGTLPVPAPRRAMPLRLALAVGTLAFVLDGPANALLRLPLALLAMVALGDDARGAPAGIAARLTASGGALVLALLLGFGRHGLAVPLAVGTAATLSLVPLGVRPVPAALVTAAAALFGAIWLGDGLSP